MHILEDFAAHAHAPEPHVFRFAARWLHAVNESNREHMRRARTDPEYRQRENERERKRKAARRRVQARQRDADKRRARLAHMKAQRLAAKAARDEKRACAGT